MEAPATQWPRLLIGLAGVYALFHGVATALGSDRGQYGLVVGGIVVGAAIGVERLLFGVPARDAVHALGLGPPRRAGLLAAAVACAALLLVFPIFGAVTSTRFGMAPGWAALLPGLFAQAGIAEETLFRGYLFRHVRRGRPFWRAVALAGLPFVAVHLVLFFTLPWPVASAAVLLSLLLCAPFAHLFELGGGTVWAPALVHFVVQGAIKLVVPEAPDERLPLVWMAASGVLPYLVFLRRRPVRLHEPVAA
jgi:membrane protease YdiL (CAAX protease family)